MHGGEYLIRILFSCDKYQLFKEQDTNLKFYDSLGLSLNYHLSNIMTVFVGSGGVLC